MIKKLRNSTVAAAALAALFLVGACASTDDARTDEVVEIRPEQTGEPASVVPAPGPAVVDSDGNVYSSSNAPGGGNAATVGTNTNVNIVPDKSRVEVRTTDTALITTPTVTETTVVETETVPMTSATVVETTPVVTETTPVVTETIVEETTTVPSTTTVTTTETTVPMTSSVQETTTTTTTEETPAPTRTRMRKD